jgi:hypothetical protein
MKPQTQMALRAIYRLREGFQPDPADIDEAIGMGWLKDMGPDNAVILTREANAELARRCPYSAHHGGCHHPVCGTDCAGRALGQ